MELKDFIIGETELIDDNFYYKDVVGAIPENIASAYNEKQDSTQWFDLAKEASDDLFKSIRKPMFSDELCDIIEKKAAILLAYAIEIKKGNA